MNPVSTIVALQWDTAAAVNLLGSAAIIAMGIFLIASRPRRRVKTGLGVMLLYPIATVVGNINQMGAGMSLTVLAHSNTVGNLAGIVGVVIAYGRTSQGVLATKKQRVAGLLVGLPAFVAVIFATRAAYSLGLADPPSLVTLAVAGAAIGLFYFVLIAYMAVLAIMALDSDHRPETSLFAALLFGAGFYAGAGFQSGLTPLTDPNVALFSALAVTSLVIIAAIWLVGQAKASRGRLHMALAWVTLLLPLAGVIHDATGQSWGYGASRLLGAAILVYAILRHQMFDLDVKVKWTIKQSTIAAIFVAVFFIVSEAAQTFLGDQTGSQYWGIAGAGALVFAIAPLQRLAERISDTAMPGVKPVIAMDDSEKAYVYEQAARAAWADGTLSKDERNILDKMRESLGLTDGDAARIERQASR